MARRRSRRRNPYAQPLPSDWSEWTSRQKASWRRRNWIAREGDKPRSLEQRAASRLARGNPRRRRNPDEENEWADPDYRSPTPEEKAARHAHNMATDAGYRERWELRQERERATERERSVPKLAEAAIALYAKEARARDNAKVPLHTIMLACARTVAKARGVPERGAEAGELACRLMRLRPDGRNPTHIDHAGYAAKVRGMSDAALLYTIRDAQAALRAHPEGHKAGYYADEINYCASELAARRRRNPGKRGRYFVRDEWLGEMVELPSVRSAARFARSRLGDLGDIYVEESEQLVPLRSLRRSSTNPRRRRRRSRRR